jgi:energy-coupling factor transporter ATP-binding protein EcfA2
VNPIGNRSFGSGRLLMSIKSIHIKGYKALKDITISNPAKVNYLVGKNGCGKSSVLEALLMLSKSIDRLPGHGIDIPGLTKYAFASDVHVYLTFDNDKGFRLAIPHSVEISVGSGNFGIAGDVITLWDGQAITGWPDRIKRDIIRQLARYTITTRYVSPFVQQEDSAAYVILPEHMALDFNNIDAITEDDLLGFLNQNYPLGTNEAVSDVSSSLRSDKAVQFTVIDKNTKERVDKIALSQLSSGLRSIARFYFGLSRIVKEMPHGNGNLSIVCIEEPENGFHPEIHKRIPELLNIFTTANPDLIFMVSTHSPFIISAAGQFTDHKTYILDK